MTPDTETSREWELLPQLRPLLLQIGLGKAAAREKNGTSAEDFEDPLNAEEEDDEGPAYARGNVCELERIQTIKEHRPLLQALQEEHATFEAVHHCHACSLFSEVTDYLHARPHLPSA